jgi:predicted chitinase
MNITAAELTAAAPHAHPDIVAAIVAGWPAASAKYGLTNRNRALGFLSTASEESGGFTLLSENLNYSAERAHEVFGRIFPTAAAAAPYAHQPEAFANKVYNGRMGNAAGSDDGWRYRGQGLIQITGRSLFANLETKSGLPLIESPAMVTSAEHMLECSVAVFVMYPGILGHCDNADWRAVWALVGSGSATGPVINFANHEAALAALDKALPAN